MDMIKPLIKQQLSAKKLLYKPCAVIMGRTGAGKTTLVNTLCETEHAAGEGRGSVTRNLYLNDISYGDHTFSLIDTPGTDSSSETYKHAVLLREGLTAKNINTIFIVIKYDSRFDKMVENYFEVEQPVYNYTDKVVVMISHWDQSKNPQKNYEEICELFQDECPKINNLIFYSDRSSTTEVSNLMYSCISNMKKDKLKIEDEEFFLKFNIYEMKNQMKVSFKEYEKKIASLLQEYTDLINSVQCASVEDKDEVLHMTIVQFKNEAETMLQDFQRKHGGAMMELDYYAFSIKMQKENVRICDDFVEKVVPLMSYNLFDNQDPRNLIKRCPYCKLIWFKTEGCDGITTCGNNSFSKRSGITSKAFWKYQVQRIEGKLQWTKNPVEDVIEENSEEKPEENFEEFVERPSDPLNLVQHLIRIKMKNFQNKANSKRVGCGKKFKWSELPKIEDELILELFKVKTIDQAKQLIQAGNFQAAKTNYEHDIDSNFYF
ncbi:unnamed protein product [Rotaria sordida]|uniref:G domain-containing protein n=1 Tax=Rotaria sordida TaxID=392033 RepID=A0A814RZX6_9BILA|nr:unnamed protein product [Rotaria sordida]CAF1371576.1 unnamed protein product [Rotaria sordida]